METAITILRELWYRRTVVAIFAAVAIVVGGLVAFRPSLPPESRTYEVGEATARILLDTPASQAVEVAPKGSETLGARANLLANLMAEGDIKAAIAKRAGLEPDELYAFGPSSIGGEAAPAGSRARDANLLTMSVLTDDIGGQLPIIDIDAQATDARTAAALANAAVAGLQDYLVTKAAADRVDDARRLQARALGAAQAADVARGPSAILAAFVTIFLFVLLCGLLLLVSNLVRVWRMASDVEDELSAAMNDDGWDLDSAFRPDEGDRADAGSGDDAKASAGRF